MSVLAQTEDCIVAAVQAALTVNGRSVVRIVETAPATFAAEELAERSRSAPAAYVAFLGGKPVSTDTCTILDAVFAVYALTANAAGEKARRRGDASPLGVGAYDILEFVTPTLEGMAITTPGVDGGKPQRVPGSGTLQFDDVANLWAKELDALGVSLYAAMFRVKLQFQRSLPTDIAAFQTFRAQWDIPPFETHTSPLPAADDTVDAEDVVSLPQ